MLDLLRQAIELVASACFIVLATLLAVTATFLVILAVELSFEVHRFGKEHTVLCPHSGTPARVKVHALRAAMWTAVSDEPVLRVKSCSLQAARPTCAQECVHELRCETSGEQHDAHSGVA